MKEFVNSVHARQIEAFYASRCGSAGITHHQNQKIDPGTKSNHKVFQISSEFQWIFKEKIDSCFRSAIVNGGLVG